jgi:hypothetical protein
MSHHRSIAVLVFLAFLLVIAELAAFAQDTSGAALPSEPTFSALLIDGKTVSGSLVQLGANDEMVLAGKAESTVPLRQVVKLTREGSPPPYPPEGTLVLFPDGDRLKTRIGPADDTALETHSDLLGKVAIPLDSILGLVLTPPAEPEAFDTVFDRLRIEPRKSEVLWLANGDRLTGGFLGLGARTLKFQGDAAQIEVERDQVVALGFDPALVSYPRPKGMFLELTLTDGSRLGVSQAKVEQGQLAATTRFGAAIRLALGDLARVHVRSEAVAYLSERAADAASYVSYVSPTRPYRRDAAVDGHPLRLGGQTYDRGLGTQSMTLLAYRLQPGDRRFQALVGLDDRAGPLGGVVFRVRVDGNVAFVSSPMSARDTPVAIDVDVTGAKLLILITEFGPRGEVRDWADWVEARLIR